MGPTRRPTHTLVHLHSHFRVYTHIHTRVERERGKAGGVRVGDKGVGEVEKGRSGRKPRVSEPWTVTSGGTDRGSTESRWR